ncbi:MULTISPECIES: FeoA family protein [unclassified Breznakia]|uniref:FeoA family protein n=1 Tax=unclassified Breznakia TaxID=2623764 RepID=UPI0024730E78|nr:MULTISPECIES: FeoA family protein [unclassified Breznakia]MDH6367021.1 ferrous iron transport protein A [Breznakia sp. PH1-1]MDH6404207.1 ferrous iron transport protein A [Breznakia sp. PF1-11]MDH6411908.1 ferrous iron transport protein A [Breznakia sp. PFB1-11]MDH6414195.1 ferrous iron transport protein A [Breznakia sp. PFB1-14]MDH6415981.1 ferrous iron transport protein A [Breznakia sp. PFB1-4]
MPLIIAPLGKSVKVMKYSLDEGSEKRLRDLGLVPGCEIAVVQESGGDLIIQVKDARIALSKSLARKIFVA